ncbi:ribonuclease III domain-containing protein [Phaeosphaeriaceae sp. PMI808]|nr:ribonuclease III domain-containing protein [Phaeosphaeriaceae sp. PMI808]
MIEVESLATSIEYLTGYVFIEKILDTEAVQMASPQIADLHNSSFRGLGNNKRLAILGDAVLTKIFCAAWFDRCTNDLTSNEALAQCGFEIGVDRCIHLTDGLSSVSPKMVATTLEAIIGAVFRDGGDEAALRVVTYLRFLNHWLLTVTLHFFYIPI